MLLSMCKDSILSVKFCSHADEHGYSQFVNGEFNLPRHSIIGVYCIVIIITVNTFFLIFLF